MNNLVPRRTCLCAIALCALLGIAAPSSLRAQSGSAIVSGTVVDPDGKAVQNADVSVKNETTGGIFRTSNVANSFRCRTVGQRGKPKAGFPSLPTSPWKSLRDSHIPPAPTATAWESGNPKAGFPLSHAHSFTLKPKNHERRSIPGLIASLQAHLWIRKCYYGVKTDLGSGWKLDNKVYFYRYWNKRNYVNSYPLTFANSVDKLNGYSKGGDITTLSWESRWGVFRTGAWYEWAYTDRYQAPYNTVTNIDVPTPNFHEHFITQSVQPFAEFEYKVTRKLDITAGIKSAYYNMNLNQFQDRSKVGCLGGTLNKTIDACIGGAAFTTHDAGYNSWLPSIAAHYFLKNNWSAYAQFGSGALFRRARCSTFPTARWRPSRNLRSSIPTRLALSGKSTG